MKTPDHTIAEVFPEYIGGEVVADSATLKWSGLFVRRYRFPRVVDGFLVPATAEPLIAAVIAGSAEFQEREVGGAWLTHQVRRGDLFVTRSTTPYELRWRSPLGAELDVIHIHIPGDECLAAFEILYPGKSYEVEVTEFFGRDETLAYLSFACAEMLSAGTTAGSQQVRAIAHLFAIHLGEKYTNIAARKSDYRGGLPITRLRKIQDYVRAHLTEDISIETLAELAELSSFHFCRVFKQATGMTPLQFVTRERMLKAQRLIRETPRSLIEIGLEVGYTSPSYFAQAFRRAVGKSPSGFRNALSE
ncbi:MAG: helix-turn-helix transcriptional regulator [Verrucomicrobia bacterium]|nr:helix-turn-helix transcriptional regulator [Verrucomicrobiota bacterium]